MLFTITIDTENDAFAEDAGLEIARMLREVAGSVETHGLSSYHYMKDINGNSCGTARYFAPEPEQENHATRCVGLWIDNDEGLYLMVKEWAKEAAREALGSMRGAEGILADRIKEYFEEENPLADDNGAFADLMNHAIGDVDWYKLAEDNLPEEDDTEDEDEE